MAVEVQHEDAAEYEKNPAADREQSSFREYVESLLVTILIVLFGTTFIVQTFKIPSPSMERTLLVGDYLLVNKFIFGGHGAWYEKVLPYRDIRHGDVIVFKFPYDDHQHYVKRVIGMPGDRIRIADQKVYVNGAMITEPYVVHDPTSDDPFGDDFPPITHQVYDPMVRPEWAADIYNHIVDGELVVPQDEYFAMGDNRDHSWDCRYWGFVRRDAIMGRPVVIYWSIETSPEEIAGESPSLIHTLEHLPSRVRWSRMLHEVH
jgi:signal peptidase I